MKTDESFPSAFNSRPRSSTAMSLVDLKMREMETSGTRLRQGPDGLFRRSQFQPILPMGRNQEVAVSPTPSVLRHFFQSRFSLSQAGASEDPRPLGSVLRTLLDGYESDQHDDSNNVEEEETREGPCDGARQ
jgi:hypothetical protein